MSTSTAEAASAAPSGLRRRPLAERPGLVAAVLLGGGAAAALAVAPSARLVPPLLLLATLVLVARAARRRPEAALALVLYLWFFAPGARRAIDSVAGFDENSPVLLLAPLASVVALLACGRRPRLRARLGGGLGRWLVAVVLAVGLAGVVALVLGSSPVAIGIAALQYASPACLGLVALACEREALLATWRTVARTGATVLGGYGIVQFVALPAWDARWMRDVADVANSFGRPEPFEVRVFSLSNSPGTLAPVLVWCLLVLLVRPVRRGDLLPVVLGTVALGLSLVRSGWIVLLVALLVLVVRRRVDGRRLLAVAAVVVAVVVAVPALGGVITDRIDTTTRSGSSDLSFQERLAFQTLQLPRAAASATGAGLGSTGAAVRRDDAPPSAFADADSGYLELLRTFGAPACLYLLGAALVLVAARRRGARAVTPATGAWLAATPVYLLFSNPLFAVAGVLLWQSLADGAGDDRRR